MNVRPSACLRIRMSLEGCHRLAMAGTPNDPGYGDTADCGMLAGWSRPRRYAAADAPRADRQGRPPT